VWSTLEDTRRWMSLDDPRLQSFAQWLEANAARIPLS